MQERLAISQLLAMDQSGINGDDAALVSSHGSVIAITTDTSVDGVHIDPRVPAKLRGYRAAACALSDLAAMAARPQAVVCAISIPHGHWMDVPHIAAGVAKRAREAGCELVGGDLTSASAAGIEAPGSICVTCIGSAPAAGAPLVSGAQPGDMLAVTGWVGRAYAGHAALVADLDRGITPSKLTSWYLSPPDRHAAARAIAPCVHAMTDISDGIAAEAMVIAERSGVRVSWDLDALPIDPESRPYLAAAGNADIIAATWGDDYELAVTLAPAMVPEAHAALRPLGIQLTIIGRCADGEGAIAYRNGMDVSDQLVGFAH